ncbi:MAG: hypothetical protein JO112_16215 [Planctomycetes bacterium]|nr:hypothetical protein [Planctomycetota bacterium]
MVLEPRDPDGQAIKAPGSVHVTALEKNPEGVKTPLDSWDMTPEQLRRTWRSGLFSTGYFLILPWKHWPTSPKLRVEVQFTLADGRLFEADKDITIHLRPESSHPAPPAFQPMEPPPHHLNPDPDAAPPGKEDPGPLLGQRMPPPVAAWKGLVIESTSLRVNESLSGAAQLLPPVAGR